MPLNLYHSKPHSLFNVKTSSRYFSISIKWPKIFVIFLMALILLTEQTDRWYFGYARLLQSTLLLSPDSTETLIDGQWPGQSDVCVAKRGSRLSIFRNNILKTKHKVGRQHSSWMEILRVTELISLWKYCLTESILLIAWLWRKSKCTLIPNVIQTPVKCLEVFFRSNWPL